MRPNKPSPKKEARSFDLASSHLREASRLGDVGDPRVPSRPSLVRHVSIGGHPSKQDHNMRRSIVSNEELVLLLGIYHVRFSNPDMRSMHDSSQDIAENVNMTVA